MISRLGVMLESAMKVTGVAAAVVVDSHGCVLESGSWIEGDLAASGASASQMLRQWVVLGSDLGIGAVQSVLIERVDGAAAIMPAGQDAVLLIIGHRSCRPGRLHLGAKRARDAMGEDERVTAEPDDSTAWEPSATHLQDLARTVDDVPSTPPPHLAVGEIVLSGTHTFRLVTKLIAQLLQTKGVQSSRLRAYSPNSTIIDVVLEDGATLAALDTSCLEEFTLERTEERASRLVLRAGKAPAISAAPIGSLG